MYAVQRCNVLQARNMGNCVDACFVYFFLAVASYIATTTKVINRDREFGIN